MGASFISRIETSGLLDLDVVLDRLQEEGEGIVAVGNLVFRTGNRTPAVHTTQAHLYLLEEEVGQVSLLYLG